MFWVLVRLVAFWLTFFFDCERQMIKNALEIHLRVQRIPSIIVPGSTFESETRPLAIDGQPARSGRRGQRTSQRDDGEQENGPRNHPSRSKTHHHDADLDINGAAAELSNQAYAWIDTAQQPCSPPPEEESLSLQGGPGSTANFPLSLSDAFPERQCSLLVSDDIHLGLLIRGGLEYGLGIYVTGLDKASAAEAANLQVCSVTVELLFIFWLNFRLFFHFSLFSYFSYSHILIFLIL